MAELLNVTPVAGQIKPIQGMTLGEMVNVARGAQNYKREGISLTLEQQQEAERARLQEFLARPENYQTEGRVDINKLNAEIPRIAPLTGADWMSKFTGLSTAQTQASQASQNLTQTQREMIASRLSIMGRLGVNDKRAYISELDQLVKENPNNKDLANLVGAYKNTLNLVPDGADLPSLAISGANSLLSPQQQQATFAPQAGTINTGAATFQTTTRPSVAGEAPTTTVGQQPLAETQLGPGSREVHAGYDTNNNPIIRTLDAAGKVIGERVITRTPSTGQLPGAQTPRPVVSGTPAPSVPQPSMQPPAQGYSTPGAATAIPVQPPSPITVVPPSTEPATEPVARLRPGETPETYAAANNLRIRTLEAAAQVPQQMFNNNEIIKLSDEALTGKGAGLLANLTGGYAGFNAIGLGGGNATALNQLGHYMALQTATLAQSAGLGTDAARNIAAESTGTISWTPEAIKKTAQVNRSLATATDLFNRGAQAAFDKTKDPFAVRDFQNKWSQTVDINAIRLIDAIKNNDKPAIKEVVTAVGGPNSAGYKKLRANSDAIDKLLRGQ
jgi:hypothetical protein